MAADSAIDVALQVAAVFEGLGVEYLVSGSLASSLHGEPRSTQDVDLVAALAPHHSVPLVSKLSDDFYLDEERVERAIQQKSSFNAIHLPTSFKVDVFVLDDQEPSLIEMRRRERFEIAPGKWLWVATAEDMILQKLRWYELGDRISDRQWRDVLSILKVNVHTLDWHYLSDTAKLLEVEALLDQASIDAER